MPSSRSALQEAYAECKRIVLGHYENFPVGSLLIPKNLRPHFFALYAFMRTADDFADLPHRSSEERLKLLGGWRELLHSSFGHCEEDEMTKEFHPTKQSPIETVRLLRRADALLATTSGENIFIALTNTIREYNLDRSLFDRLLDAFEFDARGHVQFETFEDLHWYTKHSAEPVGELVLALFGYRDAERIEASNKICTALQLINFLQDAKDDLANGGYYFPLEDLRQFGIGSPVDISSSKNAAKLVGFECDRIHRMLDEGRILPTMLKGRLRLEIKAVLAGADTMLAKIRSTNVFVERPALSSLEQKLIVAKALLPF
jgi:squalene synthase HpnC